MQNFARTRQQEVVDLLERLVSIEDMVVAQPELLKLVAQIGTKTYFQILDDIIARSEGKVRIIACRMLIVSDNRPIPQLQAVETLRRLAVEGSQDERLLAITYLVETKNATKEIVPLLAPLLETLDEDDHRRVLVAAAIHQAIEWDDGKEFETLWLQAIELLVAAFESSQPYARLIAAQALQHSERYTALIRESILESCRTTSGPQRFMMLSFLGKIAGKDPAVIESLMAFAREDEFDAETRIAAIHALIHAPEGHSDVEAFLLSLTRDDDWNVALKAITVLCKRRGTLPKESIELLISNLSHPSPSVRSFSASAVTEIPAVAGEIYPHLVQRLELEEDGQVGEAVLQALRNGGRAALQAVIEAIERAEPHQLHPYQVALIEISREAVLDVAELLTSPDGKIRGSVLSVLHSRGPLAAAIVPLLNQLLDAEDRETVENALHLLRSIGPASIECLEKLGALLQSSDEEIRILTQTTLLGIGPICVPRLRQLRPTFPEWERDFLDECLRLLSVVFEPDDQLIAGVDGVTNENDLELFCLVAELLQNRGPLTFRKLGELLSEQAGKTFRHDLPCSEAKIRETIARLEESWSEALGIPVRLIDRSRSHNRGLSEELGCRYFRRSREYLDRLRIVRGKST